MRDRQASESRHSPLPGLGPAPPAGNGSGRPSPGPPITRPAHHPGFPHRNGRPQRVLIASAPVGASQHRTLGRFSPWLASAKRIPCAPVAQLDRASGFEPEGRGFESLPARHIRNVRAARSRGPEAALDAPRFDIRWAAGRSRRIPPRAPLLMTASLSCTATARGSAVERVHSVRRLAHPTRQHMAVYAQSHRG